MNADGSISGEEYLNLAIQAHTAWKRRQALEPDLSTFHNRPERAVDKENDRMLLLMQQVNEGRPDIRERDNRLYARLSYDSDLGWPGDCDITVRYPHKLPQRQRFVRLGPFPDHISPPMMLQQDTGVYPSVQDHEAGRSPAFTFTINDFGHFVYYRASEGDGVPQRVGTPL
jgi:hypothetical protein